MHWSNGTFLPLQTRKRSNDSPMPHIIEGFLLPVPSARPPPGGEKERGSEASRGDLSRMEGGGGAHPRMPIKKPITGLRRAVTRRICWSEIPLGPKGSCLRCSFPFVFSDLQQKAPFFSPSVRFSFPGQKEAANHTAGDRSSSLKGPAGGRKRRASFASPSRPSLPLSALLVGIEEWRREGGRRQRNSRAGRRGNFSRPAFLGSRLKERVGSPDSP